MYPGPLSAAPICLTAPAAAGTTPEVTEKSISEEGGRKRVRVAMVQACLVGGDRDGNISHVLELVAQAAAEGADVVVLPEAFPLGWTDPSAAHLADAVPDGETCRVLRRAARDHGIHLCSGVVERAGGAVYNAAVLIDPSGGVVLHHRKLNELDIGHASYATGDRLGVADTELGRVGLMICADGFAEDRVVARTLGLMGAELILSPSAWAVPADHDQDAEPYGHLWRNAYGPVCREHELFIVGVSNVGWIAAGPWEGRKCIGCSLLMGPDGIVAEGPYGVDAETIVRAEIAPGRTTRPWHHPPDRWFRPTEV
jgi:predicted amidohydrolase